MELSLYVVPRHRRRGIATVLCAFIVKHCLENGLDPHWDAANKESCALAEKLGYTFVGEYQAYYLGE